jgi:ketosteroid isomerase-like protein
VDRHTEQLIRRFYEFFAAGELDRIRPLVADEVEFVNPPEAVEGGTRRGRSALDEVGRTLHEQFDYQQVAIEQMREGPDGVAVSVRLRLKARGSGVPVDERFTHVLQVRDGRIARVSWFSDPEDAARAAGL